MLMQIVDFEENKNIQNHLSISLIQESYPLTHVILKVIPY